MIFYGLGEWASKKYANTQSLTIAVWVMVGYTVNALMFLSALTKWNNLARCGTLATCSSQWPWRSSCFMSTSRQSRPAGSSWVSRLFIC